MAKKDFDVYYNNMKEMFISTVETAEELRQEALAGTVTQERVDNFKAIADPVVHTFRILQDVKRILDKPVRKAKVNRYLKQSHKLCPEDEMCRLDNIYDEGMKGLSEFNNSDEEEELI